MPSLYGWNVVLEIDINRRGNNFLYKNNSRGAGRKFNRKNIYIKNISRWNVGRKNIYIKNANSRSASGKNI